VRTVYLDYNATTPLDPAVRAAMMPFLEGVYGNPSSIHRVGRQARALLDEARDQVAGLFRCRPSEVIFTSGGTESSNLAIAGTARLLRDKGRHIITSAVEHHAVLHTCDYLERREGFAVTRLPVDAGGRVDPEDVAKALRPDTILVSVMAANNEVGTVQPVAEIGRVCRARGVLFHTDAVQWFGKVACDDIHALEADLVSFCGHKIHGPKGIGGLFIRSPLHPDPLLFGGAHENERRAGTENLAGIAGLAAALVNFVRIPVFDAGWIVPLRDRLRAGLEQLPGVTLRGDRQACLSNTVACTVAGTDSIAVLAGLDMESVCASSGSACSSGSLEPSHVLKAMGVSHEEANALVRFSLGRETTVEEIDHALGVLPGILGRCRR
jgi:cysteine desulfurase